MTSIYHPEDAPFLPEILAQYDFPPTLLGAVRYGQGHINETYCVLCQGNEGDCTRFILQKLSTAAFPDPEGLMENFTAVTAYLRHQVALSGGDPNREVLGLVKTRDGRSYHRDETGAVWRLMPFIEGTDCIQRADPGHFEASARAFGRFQYLLRDYPAETLKEVIPRFHDTEDRFRKFRAALARDALGRACEVLPETAFVLEREQDCSVALQAMREGRLPMRVTHNDTKLNNVLFDRATGQGLCVIDLDTTMPGLVINDFGDSIRFGANHCREDETDLTKVSFDLELYETYTRGFLEGTRGSLTEEELRCLPWGARLMTLECGIRFLTDYLEGDRYFRTHYPRQNLDRCRTQFKLVKDMEEQFEAMAAVVRKYSK